MALEPSKVVIARRKPILNILEKLFPTLLTLVFIGIAVWLWEDTSIIMKIIIFVAIIGAVTSIVHGFSSMKITEDEISLIYPFKTFTYSPDQIISIEFPKIPPVMRFRPVGRRFLAYVIYPTSLSNARDVKLALREFSNRHNIS